MDNGLAIFTEVRDLLVAEFELPAPGIAPASRLSDLGVDSLAQVEFLYLIEARFKLDPAEEPDAIFTVGDICSELARRLALKKTLNKSLECGH